ncbi:hypothetical protein FRC18_007930, partial [Serendipita sp. 400]
RAAGWSVWSSSDPRTDHVTFGEYSNTGYATPLPLPLYLEVGVNIFWVFRSGAWNSARASFAKQLSSAVSISTVLGSGYTSWVDSTYL